MITATPDPDDEGRDEDLESALEDTLNHYSQFLRSQQVGEGKTSAAQVAARAWLAGRHDRGKKLSVFTPRTVGTVDDALNAAERSLSISSSGAKLSANESLEKQRELLSRLLEEQVAQRAEAQQGELEARSHQRRALRFAALSLGVATLALVPPVLEIVLKLLGVDI